LKLFSFKILHWYFFITPDKMRELIIFLQGVLVGVQRAARTKGDDHIPYTIHHRVQQGGLFCLSGRSKRDLERIGRIVKPPGAIFAGNERNQVAHGVGTIVKGYPKVIELETVGEVCTVAQGLYYFPASADIFYGFIRDDHVFFFAGEKGKQQQAPQDT
jgi:hypothetical protein